MSVILPALIGAGFGTASSLIVVRYQQARTQDSIRTAFAGEIDAILVAVRGPARRAAAAWEARQQLPDYKFFYPRAVFDGNVANLGELRDAKLVRNLVSLYAALEHAREEGRRLEAGTSDPEGMLRYVHFLSMSFNMSIGLVNQLTGSMPRVTHRDGVDSAQFNLWALEEDLKFLQEITRKTSQAIVEPTLPQAQQ